MKKVKQNSLQTIISNVILSVVVLIIALVSFFPQKSASILINASSDVIYKGNTEKEQVSLMFNVYWGSENIPSILDTLKSEDVKCTFFIGGSWADNNGELLKRMVEEGHEIANHGYFHKSHDKLSLESNKQEILNAEKVISSLVNVKTILFAPPSGAYSKNTTKACSELGYKVIMWSKDTIDWRDKNEELCFTRATKNVSSGDLILMHPMEHTAKALPGVLKFYKEKGLRVVTVTQNIQD